jgi:hypothetical protein
LGFIEIGVQGVELLGPEPPVGGDPLRGFAHGIHHEAAAADPAFLLADEQARLFEHAQVAGDRRERDIEGRREIGDGGFAAREAREDRPARRIRECREDDVQGAR